MEGVLHLTVKPSSPSPLADQQLIDVGMHTAEGGDGKARLLATGAGNRGGPMMKGTGDGDL